MPELEQQCPECGIMLYVTCEDCEEKAMDTIPSGDPRFKAQPEDECEHSIHGFCTICDPKRVARWAQIDRYAEPLGGDPRFPPNSITATEWCYHCGGGYEKGALSDGLCDDCNIEGAQEESGPRCHECDWTLDDSGLCPNCNWTPWRDEIKTSSPYAKFLKGLSEGSLEGGAWSDPEFRDKYKTWRGPGSPLDLPPEILEHMDLSRMVPDFTPWEDEENPPTDHTNRELEKRNKVQEAEIIRLHDSNTRLQDEINVLVKKLQASTIEAGSGKRSKLKEQLHYSRERVRSLEEQLHYSRERVRSLEEENQFNVDALNLALGKLRKIAELADLD